MANISHEIRTPLNAIVGFSNYFTDGDVAAGSEEAKEYAALIGRNCDDLLALVSDILDLSRLEAGAMEYRLTDCSLEELFSDVYKKYEEKMPQNVKFNLLLPPDGLVIKTDVVRLQQVVEHLVGNAVKVTSQGHIDMGYAVGNNRDSVHLFVTDTGRGIPEEQTGKIFERFYKIDSFMQGAGVGLSVCKTIVESLGGTIGVSSQPGKGARFTLRFPLAQNAR